jgi:BirA family transcriptional regulator, biotin operon repressor / biotin---[acetyl-CoA-carboxylase] ligase
VHVRLLSYGEVESTLDVAHELAAAGAEAGTLVMADSQTAGRGRMGRTWRSEPGAGLWLTMIERPRDAATLDVLSLRVGLALAPVLDEFTGGPVRLKWPNDLYVDAKKLAGILIEARWRDGSPEWVAIGIGINLRPPESEPLAIGLRAGIDRGLVLHAVAQAVRGAAVREGPLDESEISAFAVRDLARGRVCVSPVGGIVQGIGPSGALLVRVSSTAGATGLDADSPSLLLAAVRSGSLVLQEES